jgi:subtilisin family serine protease
MADSARVGGTSVASGVTYAVAAGTEGGPAAPYSPAGVGQAATVGATGRQDKKPAFSDRGSAVDPFAPAVSITSASAAGTTGRATHPGASTASPHGAGAAAPHLAEHRRAAPEQVANALVRGAADEKVTGRGPGSPNRPPQVPRRWRHGRRPPVPARRGGTGGRGSGPARDGSVPHGRGRSCVSTYA